MATPTSAGTRVPLLLRVLLVLLAAWALLGFLAVPWVLQRLAPVIVAANTEAELSLGDVHFDPFRLRLRLHQPSVMGPRDDPEFEAVEVFAAETVELRLLARSLRSFTPVVALEVDAPRTHVERSPGGVINLTRLTAATEGAEVSEPATLPSLGLQRVLIRNGRITVLDRSRTEPFRVRGENLSVDLRELWLPDGPPAPLWLALGLEGATIDVRGSVRAPLELDLTLTLVDAPLALAEHWLAGEGPLETLSGTGHAAARLSLGDDGIPRIRDGRLQLHELDITLPQVLGLAGRLQQLELGGVSGALWPVDLDLGHLSLRQGRLDLTHGEAGREEAAADVPAAVASDPIPLALRLARLEVESIDVAVTDATLPIPARLRFDLDRVQAQRLAWPTTGAAPSPVRLEARVAPDGHLGFLGDLDPARSRLVGDLDVNRLPLPAVAPWVHAYSRLGLRRGALDTRADAHLSFGDEGIGLRLSLDGAIEDLAVDDPEGVGLVGWQRLGVDGLELDLGERSITLASVDLMAPTLRFARLADGSTNLAGIGPVAPAPEGDATTRVNGPLPWQWGVGRFDLSDGDLDFIDETLVIPFATRVEDLAGSVAELTSRDDGEARIELRGRIPPMGSARIEGRGIPLHPFRNTEIELDFRGVPMPRMTPWTGTFAGYRVAGGRLNLDLRYRIDGGALDASNRMEVEAMRLGERVDSPRALDVPLRLALALLRDSNDVILLDVPVSGNVDDPEFDLQPVILRAVRNVLTNIVSAPFRLLASLVGGGSGDGFDRVLYALGSAELTGDQEAQLMALETALGQRPALQLVLPAVHAGDDDRAVLREQAFEALLAETADDRGTALRQLFVARQGEDELTALETVHREAVAQSEEPGERAEGLLLAELESRLRTTVEVPDERLEALARARAEAVYLYLTDAGMGPERIRFATEVTEVDSRDERVPLRFELDATEL